MENKSKSKKERTSNNETQYKTEDIITNNESPSIIGKYYVENNKYYLVK